MSFFSVVAPGSPVYYKRAYPIVNSEAKELGVIKSIKNFFDKGVAWISKRANMLGRTFHLIRSENANTTEKCNKAFYEVISENPSEKGIGNIFNEIPTTSSEEGAGNIFNEILTTIGKKDENQALVLLNGDFDWKIDASKMQDLFSKALDAGMENFAYQLIEKSVDRFDFPALKAEHFAEGSLIHRFLEKAIIEEKEDFALKLLNLKKNENKEVFFLDASSKNSHGESLLELSCRYRLKKLFTELVAYKAEIDPKDSNGNSFWQKKDLESGGFLHELLKYHIGNKNQEVVISLLLPICLKLGFDINSIDSDKRSLLHICCHYQHNKLGTVLIENQINLELIDVNGLTAADYCQIYANGPLAHQIYEKKSFSELTESAWVAHAWGLEGTKKFGTVTFKYTGFNPQMAANRISNSSLEILDSKSFRDNVIAKEIDCAELRETFKRIDENRSKSSAKIAQGVKEGKAQPVHSDWGTHITIALFRGYNGDVMKCNRGRGAKDKNGVIETGFKRFKMQNEQNLQKTIDKLKTNGERAFQEEMNEKLNLEFKELVSQKKQPCGNCAYASHQSLAYAIFYDQALQVKGISEKDALENAKLLYKEWAFLNRLKTLENYLKITKKPDIELLGRIIKKTEELEKRKDRWKGQTEGIFEMIKKFQQPKLYQVLKDSLERRS